MINRIYTKQAPLVLYVQVAVTPATLTGEARRLVTVNPEQIT